MFIFFPIPVLIGPEWGQMRTQLLEIKGVLQGNQKQEQGNLRKMGTIEKVGGKKIIKDALL